ncbi:MAG: outer membrane protein assembly factor BamA [Candidatus Eisenbacteria bacterium]|nr:outer membrane protein assembly factor BamA [Candidatus Eisenbacteria bacterium]
MSRETVWQQPAASATGALIVLLAVASLGLVPAQAQQIATVDSLHLSGLQSVDEALLEDVLRVRPGDPASTGRIAATVSGLYRLGLFDQIRADLVEQAGQTILVIEVTERPRISAITFSGNELFNAEELMDHVPFETGEVLDRADLFRARRNISAAYEGEGFADATILPQAGADPEADGFRVRFLIEEGERRKVRQIELRGNRAFPDDELRGELATKPAGFLRKGRFSREKIDEDVARLERFYRDRGFKEATAELAEIAELPESQGVRLVYDVREGPQYFFGDSRWEGATVFPGERLADWTLCAPGEPYNQSKIDQTVATAAERYTERGYFIDLRIDPVTQVRGDTVDVTFRVREGEPSRAGDVRIVGNTRTREYVIRREISVYPGDILRRSRLLRSQRDVFATGFFEDVGIEFDPQPDSDEVDVTFRVQEKSSATATAGAGYSSQVGLTGFVQFGHNNLLGRGQAVSLKLERGRRREYYDISFTEPWVWGRPISAGFDLYRTQILREVYSAGSYDDSYWHDVWGGGVRLGFPWLMRRRTYTRVTVGYSMSETTYSDYEGLPEDTQSLLLQGEGRISRFFVSLHRNSTDNPFHPTLGTRTTWRTEFNGGLLGGDMDYLRTSIDHRQYFVPFWKPVLMLRWRAGYLTPYHVGSRLPSTERYRLGGTLGFDLLRGYDDYYIVPEENIRTADDGSEVRFPGGNVMFAFTAELQFPIVNPLYGALFLDAGDSWNSVYDLSLGSLKYGLGAGVTIEIPMLGPVGLYYGYGTETGRWKTHFAFGTQL